jgi:hypothetical protein
MQKGKGHTEILGIYVEVVTALAHGRSVDPKVKGYSADEFTVPL